MATYNSFSGQYQSISGDNYQVSGIAEASHNEWTDIVGSDPLSNVMIDLNPVFFDALYEPRMPETYANVVWYDAYGHKFPRHYGKGVVIGAPDQSSYSGIRYSDFLNSKQFNDFTIMFVARMWLSHDYAAAHTEKIIFTANSTQQMLQVQSHATNTAVRGQGDPSHLRLKLGSTVYVNETKTDLSDYTYHLITITNRSQDLNNDVRLYIDNNLETAIAHSGDLLPNITDFAVGLMSGDGAASAAPYPAVSALSMSHLAIYDYAVPESTIAGLPANMWIPDLGGGTFVVADGRWRRVLL
jgi:hypothetical protein